MPEINARIDEQRQIIENLAVNGHDITSAKIVLDSLLMSLFLCVQERQRLRVRGFQRRRCQSRMIDMRLALRFQASHKSIE